MPLYEYECGKCHLEFELLIRGDETPACPQCQGTELARKFSVPAAGRSSSDLPLMPRGGCGAAACQSGCQFE
ncbi:MAG: zinc ribbon domain-containing protein [Planctomycetales bacterium]|nr:zinc ribbon domain-containing protein [Planctomycetales bacterium]